MRKSAAQIIFQMQLFRFSQICTVHNFVCASFRRVHNLFLLRENFSAHIKKIITISRKNLRSLKKITTLI